MGALAFRGLHYTWVGALIRRAGAGYRLNAGSSASRAWRAGGAPLLGSASPQARAGAAYAWGSAEFLMRSAGVVLARTLASAEGRHSLRQAATAADEDADR